MKNKSGWAGLTPCENLKHCCISRPPLVLFTAGLCILAIAFVSLAVYVENTKLITDPNYDTDWSTFLADLTELKWSADPKCMKEKELDKLPDRSTNLSEYQNRVSITVMVDVTTGNFEMADGDVYQAIIWKERILPKENLEKKTRSVIVSFSPVKVSDEDVSSDSEQEATAKNSALGMSPVPICMTILSAEPFLSSKLLLPEVCSPSLSDTTAVTIYACSEGADTGIPSTFSVVHDKEDTSFRMYLTEGDRTNIHVHLMSTSYFLFVMAVTVFLYGLIKRRSHAEASNQLLPT